MHFTSQAAGAKNARRRVSLAVPWFHKAKISFVQCGIRARSFLRCGAAAFEDEANLVAQAQAVVDAAEEAEVQKDPGFLRKATTRGVFVQNSEIQSRLMYKDVHTHKCIVTYSIAHNI